MLKPLNGFPSLVPALITKVNITQVNDIGKIHTGAHETHYAVNDGTIETVPGFEPAFKAKVVFGADWFRVDADGNHARIDLRGIARSENGCTIDFRAAGVVDMTTEIRKILSGDPSAATIPFGSITASHTFLVADPALKIFENGIFVSNTRFITSDTGIIVETRQSLVVASKDMD
ncbi:hypothetical protein F4680DRAFT_427088 [Xylaria scruposa]|nr:hypothetical protein F4680DRAFT_427088 [Xylaria scruposa]